MRVFLVDAENVGWAALDGVDKLTADDMVCVLVNNANSNANVKNSIIIDALRSPAKFVIEETKHIGKNYLDFQLSVMVGMILVENSTAEIIVLSKDQGYQAVLDYVKKINRKASQASSIKEYFKPTKQTTKIEADDALDNCQEQIITIIRKLCPKENEKTIKRQAKEILTISNKKALKQYCASHFTHVSKNGGQMYSRLCQLLPL